MIDEIDKLMNVEDDITEPDWMEKMRNSEEFKELTQEQIQINTRLNQIMQEYKNNSDDTKSQGRGKGSQFMKATQKHHKT